MITLCCPHCGVNGDIELFLAADDGLAVARLIAGLRPEMIRDVMAYLRLFNPPKKRMALKKVARLLEEIQQFIKAGEFSRDKMVYPATPQQWLAGIRLVLDAKSINLPLEGHGYLLSVMVSVVRQGHTEIAHFVAEAKPTTAVTTSKTATSIQKVLYG
jgi:hypothetical protein